jgi:hypothetical protein
MLLLIQYEHVRCSIASRDEICDGQRQALGFPTGDLFEMSTDIERLKPIDIGMSTSTSNHFTGLEILKFPVTLT